MSYQSLSMWQDMGLYWAWRGAGSPTNEPPTSKVIEYEDLGWMRIACRVIENGQSREVFKEEREARRTSGKHSPA